MNYYLWTISAWIRLFLLIVFAVSLGFVLYTPYAALLSLADPNGGNRLLQLRSFDEINSSLFAEKIAPQFIGDPISACGFNLVLLPIQTPEFFPTPGDSSGHPLPVCSMAAGETPVNDSTHLAGRPMVVRVRDAEQALTVFDFTGLRTVVPGIHPLDANPCPIRNLAELQAEIRGSRRVPAEMRIEQGCANELIGRFLARVGSCAIADWKRRIRSGNEPNCANELAMHESLPWYEQARVESEIGEKAQAILFNALRSRASEIELTFITGVIYSEIPWLALMLISFLLFNMIRMPRPYESNTGTDNVPQNHTSHDHQAPDHSHDTNH